MSFKGAFVWQKEKHSARNQMIFTQIMFNTNIRTKKNTSGLYLDS